MTPPQRCTPPAPPADPTVDIRQALADSEPLARLTRRLRESQARMAAIMPLLPPALRAHVRAGPIDEDGWTVLATSNAVSAKLRQMLPLLQAHLNQQGLERPPMKVRLLASR